MHNLFLTRSLTVYQTCQSLYSFLQYPADKADQKHEVLSHFSVSANTDANSDVYKHP